MAIPLFVHSITHIYIYIYMFGIRACFGKVVI